ncbi:BPTI/Kunitz domain-containing protein-like [Sinocyclocheilus rhinocerous]|uniref:BPTI/Kunitz domain-containing protein-like n=1 Tax=Sinocyclocheilus rhinocerous TaxID=307959 RepID=UPI0007B845A7|nr:PREDICTED: BPTI/Kunitz domain-containing protein-like [Sinocyclocheilus rhinocerous]
MRSWTLCALLLLGFGGASASSVGPRCTDPRDEGKGKEKLLKYFYDPRSQGCVPFFYRGEGGSSNRFSSDRDCVKACSPKAHEIYPDDDKVCSLPKDEGACFAAIPKYYYDTEEKMCLMFLYRGCNGNANRFDSREDCHNMCAARSGRLLGAEDLPNPDEKTVDAGLIVGVLGGIVFAGAVISAIVVFVLQKKSKKAERKPVPTSDVEMK